MHNLVVFASGAGTNAGAIISYFKGSNLARVALIVCNKLHAGVLDIAREERIPFILIDKQTFQETLLIEQIKDYQPSLLILAGFLWKIPDHLLAAFPGLFINIHPSLLPKHGGHGMYGSKVHEAVLAQRDQTSGITIHYVNEAYDEGAVILQAHLQVSNSDTTDTLAMKIHRLEHFYLPRTIRQLLEQKP